MTNTRWKPTVLGGLGVVTVPTVTAIPNTTPAPSPSSIPSHLPGETRFWPVPELPVLLQQFPDITPAVVAQAHGVLSGLAVQHWQVADWLGFAQAALHQVQQCLGLSPPPPELQQLPRHILRLQHLIEAQLHALLHPRRFFRPLSPSELWEKQQAEMQHLRQLLESGRELALTRLADLQTQAQQLNKAQEICMTWDVCACYFSQQFAQQIAVVNIIDGRRLALQQGLALLQQSQCYVAQEESNLLVLIPQIQDGILQQLVSLQHTMQHLPPELDHTQRFLLSNAFSTLIHTCAGTTHGTPT